MVIMLPSISNYRVYIQEKYEGQEGKVGRIGGRSVKGLMEKDEGFDGEG